MKVSCDACGAPHDLAPPPWVVASGRPFRMTCASCGAQQEVHPTGLQVLESGSVERPRLVTLEEAPTLSEVSGGFHRVRPSTVDTIAAGEVSGPQLAMPSPSAASNRPDDVTPGVVVPTAGGVAEADPPPSADAHEPVGFGVEVTAPSHHDEGPDPDALDAPLPPSGDPAFWRTQPDDEDELPPTQSDEEIGMARDSGAWIPGGITLPDPGMDDRGGRHYRRITAPDDEDPPRGGGDFLLRQDGDLFHVPDLATLQRWVMEHRVAPTDDLSERGAPWQKAGARADLRVFFEAVAQLDASVGGRPPSWQDPAVRPLGAGGLLPPIDDGPSGDPTQESLPIPTEELRDPGLDAPPVPGHLRRGFVPRSAPPRPAPPPFPGPPDPDEFDVPTPPSAGPPVLLAEDAATPGASVWDPITPAPVPRPVAPAADPFDEVPPARDRSRDRAPLVLVAIAALVVLGGGALLWLDRAQRSEAAPVIPVRPELAAVAPAGAGDVPVEAAPEVEAAEEAPPLEAATTEPVEADPSDDVEADPSDDVEAGPSDDVEAEPPVVAPEPEAPAVAPEAEAPVPVASVAPARAAPRPREASSTSSGTWIDAPSEAPPQPRPVVPDAAEHRGAWVEMDEVEPPATVATRPTPSAVAEPEAAAAESVAAAAPSPWGALDEEAEPAVAVAAAGPEVVLSPLDAMGYDQLVAFGWEALESDVPLAIDAFERAIRQRPGGADAHLGLGTALMSSGRRVQGARHLCTARPTVSDRDRLDIDGMLAANGQECP